MPEVDPLTVSSTTTLLQLKHASHPNNVYSFWIECSCGARSPLWFAQWKDSHGDDPMHYPKWFQEDEAVKFKKHTCYA